MAQTEYLNPRVSLHVTSQLCLLPPANKVAGRSCFESCLSIILTLGVPYDHFPWCIDIIIQGPHALPRQLQCPLHRVPALPPPPPNRFKLVKLGPDWTGTPTPGHDQTCSLWNTCSWQMGSLHPTRMLSCLLEVKTLIFYWNKWSKCLRSIPFSVLCIHKPYSKEHLMNFVIYMDQKFKVG